MRTKRIIKVICFLLIAALMFAGLGELLRDKGTPVAGFYALQKDSVSVLFLGGSHVNASYIPAVLWNEYGIASHNLFSPNAPMWSSYHYLLEALKTQKPDVLVLELFGMTYGFSYSVPQAIDSDNYTAGMGLRWSPNLYGLMASSSVFGVESPPFSEYLDLVRYHYRWKALDASYLNGMDDTPSTYRGYEILTRTESFDTPVYSDSAAQQPYIGSRIYLELILACAKANGIDVVMTMSPYAYNEAENGIYNWLEDYAAKKGVPFINYNRDYERIGLCYETDLADVGHTNYFGALKVTRDIGEYLSGNCELRTRENIPDAQQRDEDAKIFTRTAKVDVDIVTTDPLDFFASVASDPDYTVFVVSSGRDKLTERLYSALSELGFSQLQDALMNEKAFAGAVSNGNVIYENSGASVSGAMDKDSFHIETSASSEGAGIYVNSHEFGPPDSGTAFLIYENEMGKPLDFCYLTAEGKLVHSEFTAAKTEELLTPPTETQAQ